MNIIHAREVAKEMYKAKMFSQRTLISLMQSPLFVYEVRKHSFTDDELDWCKEHILNEDHTVPVNLPYKTFTLFRPNPLDDEDEKRLQKSGMPAGGDTIYHVFSGKHSTFNPDGSKRDALLTVIRQDIIDGRKCWLAISLNGEQKSGACVSCVVDGKPVKVPSGLEQDPLTKEMIHSTIATITQFAFDTMSHFCVTLKVSPKPSAGKSIEWHIARTHYLIVGRKDAEMCRQHRRGPTGEEIRRAAHWRRAHFRKLTSPKFRFKQGRAVPVRQAWVGPEEWSGTDGKIYKIINQISVDRSCQH